MKIPNLPFYFVHKNNFAKMRRFAMILRNNLFKVKEGANGVRSL